MSKQINSNLYLKSSTPGTSLATYPLAKMLGFKYIVSSNIADVAAGLATHTSIQSAINAASNNDSILILAGNYSETISLNKRLYIQGQGYGTNINGNVTLTSSSDLCFIHAVRVTQFIFNAGANGNIVNAFWSIDPIINSSAVGNNINGVLI